MKSWTTLSILTLCLLLAAGTALAERQVTVTPVTQDVRILDPGKSAAGDCLMGNLNAPLYAIGDWIYGAELYKYLFYANPASCVDCTQGFTVEAVHMYLQFGAEDVPVTFDAYVDFEEAAWDPALGCWVPGPEICVSPVYSITIDAAGLYDIALPMTDGDCDCAYFDYWYGISVNFVSAFASYPDAITDDVPVGCTSWNDYGAGWEDLQSYGFPGELIMFADIICCEPPVPTDKTSFDELKALFR